VLTLALDTATPRSSCALLSGEELLGERETKAIAVLAAADELLAEAGFSAADLDKIVCGTGPGSFTGIRIGLAVARGLALALDLPLAGVSTLAALQAGAPGCLPVIDGSRKEVFSLIEGRPTVTRPEVSSRRRGRSASVTAPFATAPCSRRQAPRFLPTPASCIWSGRASTPVWPRNSGRRIW